AYVSGKSPNTGALAAKVFVLSDGVLHMMWLNKMKLAAGVVLAVVLAGTGVGLVVRETWAGGRDGQVGEPAARGQKPTPKPDAQEGGAIASNDRLAKRRELLQKQVELARRVWEQNRARLVQNLEGPPDELFGWSVRWLDAELALHDRKSERIKALQDHLDRT